MAEQTNSIDDDGANWKHTETSNVTGSETAADKNTNEDAHKYNKNADLVEVNKLLEEQIEKIVTEKAIISAVSISNEEDKPHQQDKQGSLAPPDAVDGGNNDDNNDSVINDVIEEIINTHPTSGSDNGLNRGPVVAASSPRDENMTNNQIVGPICDDNDGIVAVVMPNHVDETGETLKEYVVEKILDKKIDSRGFAKYLVKWEGYPSSQNSWEPLEHLVDCEKVMQRYELARAAKLASKMVDVNGQVRRNPDVKKTTATINPRHKRFTIDEVLGMTEAKGQRYFLISLANTTHKAFIRASLANKLFPNKVIDYYIRNLRWKQKPPTV